MKKLISVLGFVLVWYGISLQANCLEFDIGDFCYEIQAVGNNKYKVVPEFHPKKNISGSMFTLNCQVLTSSGKLHDIGSCKRSFEFDKVGKHYTKIYIELEEVLKVDEFVYDYMNLTTKQKQIVKKVYDLRPKLVNKLKLDNPSLSENKNWKLVSDDIYTQMGLMLEGKSNKIKNYKNFKKLVKQFVKITNEMVK